MALELHRHLRTPLDPDPERTIRHMLDNREANFLGKVRAVLADPGHPYSQLFALAGCAYPDLEDSVRRCGLEKTLQALLSEGVYLSQDEYRGRREIVRGGRHIPSTPDSWLNRNNRGGFVNTSSGTTGKPVTTAFGSAQLSHLEAVLLVVCRELGLARSALVNVGAILPGYGVLAMALACRLKLPFERWYAIGGAVRGNLHYRLLTRYLIAQMRWFGASAPYPVYLGQNDFLPVAEYLARRHAEGRQTAISGYVSAIARVAAAAVDHGLDLRGCCAILVGEALTDAKRAVIESAGIKPYPTYGASDFGSIGYPCRFMDSGNCVHVLRDAVAITTRHSDLPGADPAVDSLCLTSLLPFSSRLFINVEIGDTGVVEKTSCDCCLSKLGYDLQVRDIAAISKVTAQGMTVAAGDLVQVLEERLPGRFGGRPGDYQLLETEGASQTEMVLRVRPGITAAAPEAIRDFFLAETRRLYGGSLSVLSWAHSNGMRVEFAAPELAGTGKFRAIRLLGPGTGRRSPIAPN